MIFTDSKRLHALRNDDRISILLLTSNVAAEFPWSVRFLNVSKSKILEFALPVSFFLFYMYNGIYTLNGLKNMYNWQ